MSLYELNEKQVQNLQAIILDADIKGRAASAVCDLLNALHGPVSEKKEDGLRGEHNDDKEHSTDRSEED